MDDTAPVTPERACDDLAAYDEFAPYFRAYSDRRSAFLSTVEEIVVRLIPNGARSMLDVGSGDGVRAVRIASARAISRLVLVEPSAEMLVRARAQPATEVWPVSAESLPDTDYRFDAITCLWNVLGHVGGRERRIVALRKMRSLLTASGALFLDVSNRYDVRAHGMLPVLRSAFLDQVAPTETNGDVALVWAVGGKRIAAGAHFFTPREIESLLHEAGLETRSRHVVDYRTGRIRRFVFEGCLLFELGAARS